MTLPTSLNNASSNISSNNVNPVNVQNNNNSTTPLPHQQSQHFLLKWNNHRSNMVNVFESLLQSENLVDVTIAVEGKFLKAHKIVLSACSPYFQAMFVNHSSDKYPILLFHDMKFAHLKTLLDFMYRGEISIDERDLGEVLKVAEALSIRGLSSFENEEEEEKLNENNNQQQSESTDPNQLNKSQQNGKKVKNKDNPTTKSKKNCDSANNNKLNHNNNTNGMSEVISPEIIQEEPPLPVVAKKKRGRQPKIPKRLLDDDLDQSGIKKNSNKPKYHPPSPIEQQSALLPPAPAVQPPSHQKSKTVRRRLPRRFPGVPTRLKRVKLSKSLVYPSDELNVDETGDCEPLSEMSVRGLDLFKYASIEDGVYRCIECEKLRIPKTFKNKYSFQRHAFLYHEGNMRKVFPCPVCSREFSRPDKMKNHMKSIHQHFKNNNNKPGGGEVEGGVDIVEMDIEEEDQVFE